MCGIKESHLHFHQNLTIFTHTHTHTYICALYICVYVCHELIQYRYEWQFSVVDVSCCFWCNRSQVSSRASQSAKILNLLMSATPWVRKNSLCGCQCGKSSKALISNMQALSHPHTEPLPFYHKSEIYLALRWLQWNTTLEPSIHPAAADSAAQCRRSHS